MVYINPMPTTIDIAATTVAASITLTDHIECLNLEFVVNRKSIDFELTAGWLMAYTAAGIGASLGMTGSCIAGKIINYS